MKCRSNACAWMSAFSFLALVIVTEPVEASSLQVNALVVDPAVPTTVYAGTYGAGVFKSADGGETWYPTGLTG